MFHDFSVVEKGTHYPANYGMHSTMNPSNNSDPRITACLQAGFHIITPNNRLAKHLLEEYLHTQGKEVTAKPVCIAWQMFLNQLMQQLIHLTPQKQHPVLLTTHQIHHLWRQILPETHHGLLQVIKEAWTRCQLWEVDMQDPLFGDTPQTREFKTLSLAFNAALIRMHAITSEQIIAWLVKQEVCPVPKKLVWVYFDDYTPQQKTLQACLAEHGTENIHLEYLTGQSLTTIYAADEEHDELLQLIAWLKQQIQIPSRRIAVAVPQLEQKAARLQRVLTQHIPAPFFNISLGKPSTQYPLIAHALCWLGLKHTELSVHEATLLLRSPYLAASRSEMLLRAQMIQDSALLQEATIDFKHFTHALKRHAPELETVLSALPAYPSTATVSTWVNAFQQRLEHLQFPGEYTLDSAAFQSYQHLGGLLEAFKSLQTITPKLTKEQALKALQELADNTVFQPEKPPAPIHLTGLLEASGCHFDAIWIMGMTDECLPHRLQFSAWIPLPLQRTLQMPYTSLEREYVLAEKMLTQLSNAGSEVVLSYPKLFADTPCYPTPLLPQAPAFIPQPSPVNDKVRPGAVIYHETYNHPVNASDILTGSTTLLANQAKCPFRAFAAHRLHARTTDPLSPGLSAFERGRLVHKAAEQLWTHLANQPTLLSLSEETLGTLIDETLTQVLAACQQPTRSSFPALAQAIEKKRLTRLMQALMHWEKQRTTSFEVTSLETTHTLTLGGIAFTVRIDRMDTLEDGSTWIIDYKSSLPTGSPWKEMRPEEPQILLYALLDARINTLLFAELKQGHFRCKGVSEVSHDLPGITALKDNESWETQRDTWQTSLETLATEFRAGHCPPKPLHAGICQRCDFQALCRYRT